MALRDVLNGLEGLKRTARGWEARCPAHDDRKPSLGVAQGDDGRVLLHCQAGCTADDVVKALNLTMSDLFPPKDEAPKTPRASVIVAAYDYFNEQGELLYQAVRFDPKDFRQRKPDADGWSWSLQGVRRVLYRLPQLLASTDTVFVVEGEKDVDAVAGLNLTATCNVGGAGKWSPEYSAALRGRDVVILPDNDKAGEDHAALVAKSLDGVAKSVRVVRLPGLPPKGDVSDWLAAGGTKERLLELCQGGEQPAAFQASASRLDGERAERIEMGRRALSFGIQYLDDAMGGITTRDLVIVGAKTGVGKTALATIMALHNSQRGARVHYFALEAEDREIERRMKFQILARHYYADASNERRTIRYLDWYMGRLDRELGPHEDAADKELRQALRNLHTFYRVRDFTADDFVKQLDRIKDETDLVILDHLHYVDTDDENENRGYKKIVKRIRDSALELGKPVVVVAHVRKGDRRLEPLVPTVEDFHGTSDVPKIATKGVMLAAAYDMPNPESHVWNTYIQSAKCRPDSTVTRYVAVIQFDTRRNDYRERYLLGRLKDGGKTLEVIANADKPDWAKKNSLDPVVLKPNDE